MVCMKEISASESIRSSERVGVFGDLEGMQGRLVLKDQTLLNPDEKPVTGDKRLTESVLFEERDYNPFEKTSQFDRRQFWKKEVSEGRVSVDFNSQYAKWADIIYESFHEETNNEHLTKLHSFFSTLQLNEKDLGQEAIRTIYDRYFGKKSNTAPYEGAKLFVNDILQAYSTDGKLSVEALEADMEDIAWLAGMFGEPSSEIITQLSGAEAKLKIDKTFIARLNTDYQKPGSDEKTNRLNDLQQKEIDYLRHISRIIEGEVEETEEIQKGEVDEGKEEGLPILKKEAEIITWMQDQDPSKRNLVLYAKTGAGKSTEIPRMYAKACPGQKIMIGEPRIDLTEDLAKHMAEDVAGEEIGKTYGYINGHMVEADENTPAPYVTYGTADQMLASEDKKTSLLLKFGAFFVDEVHTRDDKSILLLARLKDIQKEREKLVGQVIGGIKVTPFKIIVGSATMNPEEYKHYLGDDKSVIIEVPGRKHNINYQFEPKGTPIDTSKDRLNNKARRAAVIAHQRLQKFPGRHIVIFMPGDHQIRTAFNTLNDLIQQNKIEGVRVRKLIGSMSKEDRDEAQILRPNETSVIIASPVAESGANFKYEDSETVVHLDVITPGIVNVAYMDPVTGFRVLETQQATMDRILQQFGRAGRRAIGTAIFLETEEEFNRLARDAAQTKSELRRGDPTAAILLAKRMGYKNLDEMDIMTEDRANPQNVRWAERSLRLLGIIDDKGEFTAEGKEIVKLPLDINFAKVITEAKKKGCGKSAAILATMYSTRSLFKSVEGNDFNKMQDVQKAFRAKHPNSDFMYFLEIWREFEQNGKSRQWADTHYLNYSTLLGVEEKFKKLMKRAKVSDTETPSDEALERAIFEGFRDRILIFDGNTYKFSPNDMNVSKTMFISNDSALYDPKTSPQYITVAPDQHIRENPSKKRDIPIRIAQRIKLEWLNP